MIKKNLREKYISFNCNKTPTDEIFSFIESLNIKNISLTNFDVITKVAAENGYIKKEDVERLIKFRNNPSDTSWIE